MEYFHLRESGSERLLAMFENGVPPARQNLPPCQFTARHNNSRRVGELALEVKHALSDQMMISSWFHDWVVHESLLAEFEKRGISGYMTRPATVRFRNGLLSKEYRELIVVGWAGIARPESGIHLIEECPGCGRKKYSSLEDATRLVDWSQWTGEDFFKVWPLTGYPLITKPVANLLETLKVKSYKLDDLRHVEFRKDLLGRGGGSPEPLSYTLPEDLAIKYGRPLGLE